MSLTDLYEFSTSPNMALSKITFPTENLQLYNKTNKTKEV